MHKTLKAAALALVLSGAAAGVAYAQSVTFDVGNVAIGYSDGYWDRAHTWHAWERPEHRTTYQAAKGAEYHEWNHDRDKDMGWHDHK
jgi:hypothetical protein